MKRRWILVIGYILFISLAIVFLVPSPKSPSFFAYTTEAGTHPNEAFSVNDTAMQLVAGFDGTIGARYNVTAVWLTPQNHPYGLPFQGIIAKTGEELIWTQPINDSDMIESPGTWTIQTYVNGTSSVRLQFNLYDSRPPTQPIEYFTWPSHVINVSISGPRGAKADAVDALRQWNYSQAWFQQNFSMPARPAYELILSNHTYPSGITITFNDTSAQSTQDLGITYWSWTLQSGRISTLECRISIALYYENGVPLNDIALRNLALHEVGHCLGLAHVPHDGDTMNHVVASPYDSKSPSTLNLYALYELSGYDGTFVPNDTAYFLPAAIPYKASPLVGNNQS